jgi:hypothetical protein
LAACVLQLQWHGTWPRDGPDVAEPVAVQLPSPEIAVVLLWHSRPGRGRTSLGSLQQKQLLYSNTVSSNKHKSKTSFLSSVYFVFKTALRYW